MYIRFLFELYEVFYLAGRPGQQRRENHVGDTESPWDQNEGSMSPNQSMQPCLYHDGNKLKGPPRQKLEYFLFEISYENG